MRFCAASDQSMLVYFGDEISLTVHSRVLHLLRLLEAEPPSWLCNLQPAYSSLMVTFDLCKVDHCQVESALREYAQRASKQKSPKPRTVEIPVCYGGEFGPDLDEVAKRHAMDPQKVVHLHSSQTYYAYFLGFAPGFAYLGDIPESIATPRLETPRKTVPVGSVGIAGKQTAVYPFATPGGWRLIGRTPLSMFRADRKKVAAVTIGDKVKFRAISPEEFRKWEQA